MLNVVSGVTSNTAEATFNEDKLAKLRSRADREKYKTENETINGAGNREDNSVVTYDETRWKVAFLVRIFEFNSKSQLMCGWSNKWSIKRKNCFCFSTLFKVSWCCCTEINVLGVLVHLDNCQLNCAYKVALRATGNTVQWQNRETNKAFSFACCKNDDQRGIAREFVTNFQENIFGEDMYRIVLERNRTRTVCSCDHTRKYYI